MKKRILFLIFTIFLFFTSCGKEDHHGLSKEHPVTITLWHSYNGSLAIEFDELVSEFNNSVGRESGVVVYAESMSTLADLESALWDAANQKVGAPEMPNIFQCSPEQTAALDEVVPLINFDDYITEDEKNSYVMRFLDSGCVGEEKVWKLFPIAKSTEILILNKTDWEPFAEATGAQTQDLATWEGLAQTAEKYYEWSGGKAFFGRDAFANYMIIASSQLGHEIFRESNGKIQLDFDKDTMRKIWDAFYVPYVKGYYRHVGQYRNDDIKLGEIIALVCPSSSAGYFPTEVTVSGSDSSPIEHLVLPLPNFERTAPYTILQGAGMAVTQSEEPQVYASLLFLKWITQKEQNSIFSINSGYLPVTVDAIKRESLDDYLIQHQASDVIRDALHVALAETEEYILYTPADFSGSAQAINVLDSTMLELAVNDRASVEAGTPIDGFLTDAHFEEWYESTLSQLREYCR